MNRRQFLHLGVGTTILGVSGCAGLDPPELRVRNQSDSDHTVHVRVTQQETTLLSQSFSVPATAHGDNHGTVAEGYPGPGTYTIRGAVVAGATNTEEIELTENSTMMTHVTVNPDETLSIGELTP